MKKLVPYRSRRIANSFNSFFIIGGRIDDTSVNIVWEFEIAENKAEDKLNMNVIRESFGITFDQK